MLFTTTTWMESSQIGNKKKKIKIILIQQQIVPNK